MVVFESNQTFIQWAVIVYAFFMRMQRYRAAFSLNTGPSLSLDPESGEFSQSPPSLCGNRELNLWILILQKNNNLDLELEGILEILSSSFLFFRDDNSRAPKIIQVFSLCPYVPHSYSLKVIFIVNSWYNSFNIKKQKKLQ